MIEYRLGEQIFDIDSPVDYSEPDQIVRLKRLRVNTEAGLFKPVEGLVSLFNSSDRYREVCEKTQYLSGNVLAEFPSNIDDVDVKSTVCFYLLNYFSKYKKYLNYFRISLEEACSMAYGVGGNFHIVLADVGGVVLDLGVYENSFRQKSSDAALGTMLDFMQASGKLLFLISRGHNLPSIFRDRIEKDTKWVKFKWDLTKSISISPGSTSVLNQSSSVMNM